MSKKEKTIEEYRRDIFILKSKIKEEEKYLEELQQKYSEVDVFAEQSYTFQMKIKILQYNLADVKHKIDKYDKEEHKLYYQFNFCVYAFIRACEIVSINKQMVFRAVDVEGKGIVKYLDLANFMKEVLRLSSNFINPILKALDPEDSTEIPYSRYQKFLQVFLIESEKAEKQGLFSELSIGVENIAKELIIQKIEPKDLWKRDQIINIAITIGRLTHKLNKVDILDCVAVYCRCDPNKEGVVKAEAVITMLEQKITDVKHFSQGSTFKIKKK